MEFRLPFPGAAIPCFKLRDSEVYLVVNNTLCSFTRIDVRSLKTLTGERSEVFMERVTTVEGLSTALVVQEQLVVMR
jgi:hypothetical protein